MGQEYLASKGKAAKITIKNENAVKFIIKIDRVVFVDGSVWTKKDAVLESAGEIAIDSIYTPVTRVSYDVEKTRVGQDASYDKLTLEVWTNGSVNPQEAISLASKILVEHFSILVNLNEAGQLASFIVEREDEEKNKVLEMPIEELDLSVRSYNCLRRAGINTVEELARHSEEDMMKVRNLGKKSLKEVKDKLDELGLSLGCTK